MKRMSTSVLISVFLLLALIINKKISAQTTVTLPGNFESEMGCTYDWQPDCDATRLTQTGPTTWEATFLIPKGSWEYKVAYNNSWTENYGLNGIPGGPNIPLVVPANSLLHFSFSTTTHLIDVSYALPGGPSEVVLAGNFQTALECSGDWQPDCKSSALTYDYDSKIWWGSFAIPPGNYEYKVTIDNSWAENYGQGGQPNGPNIPLSVSGNKKILFIYNSENHIITSTVVDYNVTLAGSFQSELGCAGNWQPDCAKTALMLDAPNGLWKKDIHLQAGNWEFKVAIDNSWAENYGEGGVLGGSNILLNLSEPATVSFVYNPQTHIVAYTIQNDIVVLPGSFQVPLGCASWWDPACDKTRLTYDAAENVYKGIFAIPAGSWEYKVALNHSWNENYGLGGVQGGSNIPLNLAYPATIEFTYDPVTHLVRETYKKTTLCVMTFYDANGDGYKGWNENSFVNGATIFLSGDTTISGSTDANGKVCFSDIPGGQYTIKANLPAGYLSSSGDSIIKSLTYPDSVAIGVVCLGGAGAENISFWMNKKGKAAFDSLPDWQQNSILTSLNYFNLVNVDGSIFHPEKYNDLAEWMQQSNAKNLTYKLSAQLAALYLNAEIRMLGNRAIYTPGVSYWGYQRDFMNVYTVAWYIGQQLMSDTSSTGGDLTRKRFQELEKMLDQANSDLTFVQLQPCNLKAITSNQKNIENAEELKTDNAVVWPNPSTGYFNLRLPVNSGNATIRVLDAQGKLVFSEKGSASKVYHFGNGFVPGLYLVEIVQDGKQTTIKLVKQ